MTIELIALAPVLVLFMLLALALGRYAGVADQVEQGATAAAEAAAVAPSAAQARSAAVAAAMPVLTSPVGCSSPHVSVDTASYEPGGAVKVTITCRVRLADLAVPGFPGSASISATQLAPIDPYRAVEP